MSNFSVTFFFCHNFFSVPYHLSGGWVSLLHTFEEPQAGADLNVHGISGMVRMSVMLGMLGMSGMLRISGI